MLQNTWGIYKEVCLSVCLVHIVSVFQSENNWHHGIRSPLAWPHLVIWREICNINLVCMLQFLHSIPSLLLCLQFPSMCLPSPDWLVMNSWNCRCVCHNSVYALGLLLSQEGKRYISRLAVEIVRKSASWLFSLIHDQNLSMYPMSCLEDKQTWGSNPSTWCSCFYTVLPSVVLWAAASAVGGGLMERWTGESHYFNLPAEEATALSSVTMSNHHLRLCCCKTLTLTFI